MHLAEAVIHSDPQICSVFMIKTPSGRQLVVIRCTVLLVFPIVFRLQEIKKVCFFPSSSPKSVAVTFLKKLIGTTVLDHN